MRLVKTGKLPAGENSKRSIFWSFWLKERDALYRLCLKVMNGNAHDAEDALSSSAVKAWMYYNENHEKIYNLNGWMFTLTYNVCIDMHRERKKNDLISQDLYSYKLMVRLDEDENHDPEKIVFVNDLTQRIQNIIPNIPVIQKQVFIRRVYCDQSHKEIAEKLNISCALSRKYFQLAKQNVNEMMNCSG